MNANEPRLVGLNHIALEVGDVEEALRFYGNVFVFDLRGTHKDDQGYTVILVGMLDLDPDEVRKRFGEFQHATSKTFSHFDDA